MICKYKLIRFCLRQARLWELKNQDQGLDTANSELAFKKCGGEGKQGDKVIA